jgi:hypothetical protein
VDASDLDDGRRFTPSTALEGGGGGGVGEVKLEQRAASTTAATGFWDEGGAPPATDAKTLNTAAGGIGEGQEDSGEAEVKPEPS